jgi:outer membrane protein OmpA-like peptidoglycan-associated protein
MSRALAMRSCAEHTCYTLTLSSMAPLKTSQNISLLLASLLTQLSHATAQTLGPTASPPAQPLTEGRLFYQGDSAQISMGLTQNAQVHGEISGVLHESATHAWLGEIWGSRRDGGIKLSHHQHNTPDSVRKRFVAIDQNSSRDRKITLGYGRESANWFGQINLSKGLTGQRFVGQQESSVDTQNIGQVDGQQYLDLVTTTTRTRLFEKAYDYGIGLRFGRHFDAHHVRLTAGLDHEWGKVNSNQNTASLMAEKMFPGTPHSIALQLSYSHKSGPTEVARNEARSLLMYRYSLGNNNAQSERLYRIKTVVHTPTVQVAPQPLPAPVLPTTRIEKQWIKTKAVMNSDAFFEFDSAQLMPQALTELHRIAQLFQTQGREGPVHITGHTCDIGSDKVNDRLSLARAQAVNNHLIALGVLNANDTKVQGRGKRQPKYAASPNTRAQNRRVELEFFSFVNQESLVEITVPAPIPEPIAIAPPPILPPAPVVTFEREVVAQPPAWIQRALRSPTQHKRNVSVYRFQETSRTESTQRKWINQAPTARNDAYTLESGSATALDVMVNDSDPDHNDTITLVQVSPPTHGQVSIEGRQITYRASVNHIGPDSFSYTIEDSKGLKSTAQVNLTLHKTPPVNRAPVAQADHYTAFVGSTSTFNVLDNDSDPDANDTIRLLNVSAPAHGQVSIEGRQVTYRASATHVGPDSFIYTIEDSKGLQATARVGVLLTLANRAPQANADHFGVSGKNPTLLAVLDNDTDPDGDPLVITSVTQPVANSGKVEITKNAIFFTPNYPFIIDWFSYTISDGRGGTSTATVRLVDP